MSLLSSKRRSELRAEAHKLTPVVIIGDKGLTDEVLAELDRSLKAHELIKVRAATGEREVRDTWLETICQRLGAHAVQQIGKVFVIYRENPPEKLEKRPKPAPGRRPRSGARADPAAGGVEVKRRRESTSTAKARARADDLKRTSRPRSRTPSPRPASEPRRRRPRTSR